MFRSRRIPTPGDRVRSWVWPRCGWRRALIYQIHRLSRIPDAPHKVAAGFASGVAAAMTPFIGFQFVVAAALAVLVRGSIVASAIGSFAANPWTYPVIWLGTYRIGREILGPTTAAGGATLADLRTSLGLLGRAVLRFDGAMFASAVWPVFEPMLVGSIPVAAIAWAVAYWPIRRLVGRRQAQRARLRSPHPAA